MDVSELAQENGDISRLRVDSFAARIEDRGLA